jgi:phage tail sheath gpL-like
VIKARIGSQQKERRPAAAGRRKDSVATLLAMVTENEPSEKITALFVAGRANGLIRDPRDPVGTVVSANRHGSRLAGDQGDRHQ